MDRRVFITVVSGSILTAPYVSKAQQAGKVYRIGYLTPFPIDGLGARSFRQGLRELGYVEAATSSSRLAAPSNAPWTWRRAQPTL
jgi:hypothetical protein